MRHNLITERNNADLTQVEVASMLNISERQYQNLEAGTSIGSVPLWVELSKLFNQTINYLLEQSDKIAS